MKIDRLKPLKNLEVAFNRTTGQEQVIAEDSEGYCYGFDSWEEVYLKDEVDAAIAELKAKLVEQESWVKMLGEGEAALSLELEKTKRKLEDAKATAYAESVDAGMENRRLRRALYKACANWAKCEERISSTDAYEASEYLPSEVDKLRKEAERWDEMERKCRAKAEEYDNGLR